MWFGSLEFLVVAEMSTKAKVFAEAGSRPVPLIDIQIEREADSTVQIVPTNRDNFSSSARDALDSLSPAEFEIVLWICRGFVSDQEIAGQLHRSPHTIRTQVASIFRKLSVNSRSDLLAFIIRKSDND